MRNLRIASFAYRSHPAKGGVEYHQKLITEYFSKKKHEVKIYTSRSYSNSEFLNLDIKFPFIHLPDKKSSLKYREIIEGVKYERFDIVFRIYNYNHMKRLYYVFDKEIERYDIVHLHGLNVYNNYKLAKIAKKHGVPVILSCYDISISNNFPYIIRFLKKAYDKIFIGRLNRYVSKFLVLTKDQIPELKLLNIDAGKIQVWSAGYDVTKYRKRIDPKKTTDILRKYDIKRRQYVFNMGRIEEYKGIQDIILLANDFPKINFIIAGKDQGYLNQLKKMIIANKVNNVKFIGEIDEEEATAILQNAYTFMFPSRKEGWGIVLAEAMSVGVPCIAYNIPNVRTVFTNQKSGLFVNDITEMKQALKKMIKNKKLYQAMSKNAIIEAEKYDYHNNLPVLENIYEKNLNRQNRHSIY
ncbi:MAG: glycosyltransferase family 4 protein [Candidatus Woesearchaeota archaeon]